MGSRRPLAPPRSIVTGLIGGNRWQEAEKIGSFQSEKAIAISPRMAGATPSDQPVLRWPGPRSVPRSRPVARDAKPKQIVVIRDPLPRRRAPLPINSSNCWMRASSDLRSRCLATKKLEADVIFFACSASQRSRLADLEINQPPVIWR